MDSTQSIDLLRESLQEVLNLCFPGNSNKRIIEVYDDRLNFACPVCGDSEHDDHKKRANIYTETQSCKCFNCGYFSSIASFFYKVKGLDYFEGSIPEELLLQTTYEKITKSLYQKNVNFVNFELETLIKQYAIERNTFKNYLSAIEVTNTPMENYLKYRSITDFSKFMYLPKTKQLLVLNVDDASGNILSYQIRNFNNSKNKYLTYKLQRMYSDFNLHIPDDENFLKLNQISTYFNIMNINIAAPLTYFEGPIDCYLYPNAISLNSVSNHPPFETRNTQYFFDWDKEGRKKMRELLFERKTVFLWRKFFEKVNMLSEVRHDAKIDFNDVFTYCKQHNLKGSFQKYFSNNPMDMIYL